MKQIADYSDQGARVHALESPNGIGTHMDAPCHFVQDALAIADIPVIALVAPGVVIDVSSKLEPDYCVSEDDIVQFEQQYGIIPQASIVLIYSGWGRYWQQAERYRNIDAAGIMHFPRLSAAAAQLLVDRGIHGIAVDTLSPDGSDYAFPVHHLLLGAGKFIIENVKMTDELPPCGFTLIALPLKIQGATEAPCRVIAEVSPAI